MSDDFESFAGLQPPSAAPSAASGRAWAERVQPGPAPSAASPAEPMLSVEHAYQAFGTEHPDTDGSIEIRHGNNEWCQIFRPYLVRVEGVGDTLVSLLCTSCAIIIAGRHLGELRRLLRAGRLDFVQEFDQRRWPEPTEGAPVVERIEIIYAEGSERPALPTGLPITGSPAVGT